MIDSRQSASIARPACQEREQIMSGTEYWLRQQISLAQWRDYYKAAEHERQVEIALDGQPQPTRVSQIRNRIGHVLLSLASWLIIDDPQRGRGPERTLRLESS